MEQVTLSVEQFNELKDQIKQQVKDELYQERGNKFNAPLIAVERKYHQKQLETTGYIWDKVRAMTALLMGYKLSKYIPKEREEESAKIAEDLFLKVFEAFGGKA